MQFVPAKVGQGFRFDGSSSAVLIPPTPATDVGAGPGFTIEAWLQPFAARLIMWIGWSDNESQYYGPYGYLQSDGSIFFNIVDVSHAGHVIVSSANAVTPGEMHHVALTYDRASGEAVIYRNGEAAAREHLGSFTPDTTRRIVLGRQPPSWAFDGILDELALYNRALSSNEVAAIHAAGSAGKCKPACVPPPSSLVGWWSGDGHAFDLTTNHNDAKLQGGITYAPGKVGRAFDLTGGNKSVVIPDSPSLELTNQFTIEAWVNTATLSEGVGGGRGIVSKVGGAAGNNGYQFVFRANFTSLLGNFNSPGQPWPSSSISAALPTPVAPGVWMHVAWTYDQSAMKLYFNGQPIATNVIGPLEIATSASNLRLSGDDNGNGFWDGLIDEVSICSEALSAGQIAASYTAGSAGQCRKLAILTDLQPLRQTRAVGAEAAFRITATGMGTLSYRWRRNGTPLATNNSGSLVLTNLQLSNAGSYDVLVSDVATLTVTSGVATLNVVMRDTSSSWLAGWWPGEGDATDSLGRYDGTLQGGAGFTNGIVGSAFSPNGGYVDLGVGPPLDSFTAALWIWVDPDLNVGEQRVISHDNYLLPGTRKAFMLKSTSGGNTGRNGAPWFEIGGPSGWQGLALPASLSAGWHHLAGVRNISAAQLELYVDGTRVANCDLTMIDTIDSDVSTVLSGVSPAQQIEPFHGRIDEVAIFQCALSADEIRALATTGPAPDLVVESVNVATNSAFGAALNVSWTVRNRGDTPALGSWSDRIWFSSGTTPESSRVLLDLAVTNAATLAPGSNYTSSATVVLPLHHALTPGSFHIGVTTDVHSQVRESRDDNNSAASGVICLDLPPLPDLAVTRVVAPTALVAGQTAEVVWTVTNRGSVLATGPWLDSLYLARDSAGTGAQLLAQAVFAGSLDPGAAITVTQQVTFPARVYGERVLIARSDVRDQVFETDDTNNERASGTLTLLPPPVPDLTITNILAPAAVLPGQVIPISWTVTNQGNAVASASWTETLYLAPASNLDSALAFGSFTFSNTLPAAASVTRTQAVAIPSLPTGSWRLGVLVDSDNQLPEEQTRTNNLGFSTNPTQIQTGLILQVSATEVPEDAMNPALQATVYRNGDLTDPLTLAISNSDSTELTMPATVVIPTGQTAVSFAIGVVHDNAVDGAQMVTITVSADGYAGASAQVVVHNTDVPRLTVMMSDSLLKEGTSTNAIVMRNEVTPDPILVRLRSTSSRQLLVPDSVTIPANQMAVAFDVLALDDGLIEATQPYTVTASATAYEPGSAVVSIVDNDWPTVRVEIAPDAVSEGAGVVMATVVRSAARPQGMVLDLESSDPNALWVPERIGIQPGETFASFPILPVDNSLLDGARPVQVRAFVVDSVTGVRLATATSDSVDITDNDGPTLALVVAHSVVAKGVPAANIGTVSRNTVTNSETLVVQLTSSDTTEATVPATVTIPVGEAAVAFDINTVQDGTPDGSQSVTVRAEAAGFNGSSTTFVVSDRDLPDLVISGITLPSAGVTAEAVSCDYHLANRGLSAATGTSKQRVFLSSDPTLSGDDRLLGELTFTGSLSVGQEAGESWTFTLPGMPGDYWLIVVADALNQLPETTEDNNLSVSRNPIHVGPAYTATVATEVGTAPAGTAIPLYGSATLAAGGPAALVPVNIHIHVLGTERVLQATTAADGTFGATFQPLPGEAGHYQVEATHPAVTAAGVQDEFTLVGMSISPSSMSERLVLSSTDDYQLTLQNLSEVPLTGITAALEDVPANIDFRLEVPSALAGSSNAIVRFTVRAADDSVATGVIRITLSSAEGAQTKVLFAFRVVHPRTELTTTPGYLQASMRRGQRSFVRFELINVGAVASGDLDILLPNTSWLSLVSAQRIPSLAPGQKADVELSLSPPPDMALGVSTGNLVISGDGGATSVPFQFNTVSDLTGALLVSVADDFTYTTPGSPKVTNAVVTLTDATTLAEVATGTTIPSGELLLTNLVEAYYNLVVRADRHSEFRATLLLAGGQTNLVNAFLQRQFVTYSWNVVPIEIEDRYEFQLQTTYETHVPAPVVVVEPATVDLGSVSGDTTQVNFTFTNHGLIAARNLKFALPTHPNWEVIPLLTDLGDLAAISSIQVPVTFRRLGAESPGAQAHSAKDQKDSPVGPCTYSLGWDYWYPCGPERPWLKILVPVLNASPGCTNAFPALPREPREGYQLPQVSARNFELPPYIPELWIQPMATVAESIFSVFTGIQATFCSECASALAACALKWVPWPAPYECYDNYLDALEGARKGIGSPAETADRVAQVYLAYLKCQAVVAAGKAAEELAKRIAIVQTAQCLKLAYDHCWHSTPEGAPAVASQRGKDAGETGSPSPEELLFLDHLRRLSAEVDALAESYGDEAWLLCTDAATLGNWFTAFEQATATNSVEAATVSPSEKADLLALPLPSPVDAAIATKFIERWNRSLEYWGRGWLDSTNVPAGQNTNFVALDVLTAKLAAGLEARRKSEAERFLDVLDGALYAKDQYLMKLTENEDGVCAQVKLRLNQSAVITRSAFEGTLEINNNSGAPLENIRVTLEIRGPSGSRADDMFGTRIPRLDGMTGVDGAGSLANGASGKAIWVFIPTRDAAPLEPKQYTIGGQVTFTQDGKVITLPLFPVPIEVLPDPRLIVKYFYQREVYADDPFTQEIEPSEPFALAMMMSNVGRGTARNVTVTSAQPKIVDNEKGLLIDFDLIGSQVGGQDISPALRVTLGEISPGHSAVATWWMTTSLQGRFTDYAASFSHVDALGDKKLSLIDSVGTHELLHLVRADVPEDDGLADFLVNDVLDLKRLPDTLHLSGGGTLPVSLVTNAFVDRAPTAEAPNITLTATFPAGWAYLRLPDPTESGFRLTRVVRSDGRVLRLGTNVWTTHRIVRPHDQDPYPENLLHLLDCDSTGVYTLVYEPPIPDDQLAPSSAVTSLPANSRPAIPVQWSGQDEGGSGLAFFDVFVSVNGGPFLLWLERTTLRGALFQGTLGNSYAFYSIATDQTRNREGAPATPDAQTAVSLANVAPVLAALAGQTVTEGQTLRLTVGATDVDGPAGSLAFGLEPGTPDGVAIDGTTGDLTWTPGEAAGGASFLIGVRVWDTADRSLTDMKEFTVFVQEVNTAPSVASIADRTVREGQSLSFIVLANDADLPSQMLTFRLGTGTPSGPSIDPGSGLFRWTPNDLQGPSTNIISIIVTDNGVPTLSATQQFTVIVRDTRAGLSLSVGTTNLLVGQNSFVPLILNAGMGLTNLAFLLEAETNRLQLLLPQSLAPELASAGLRHVGSNRFELQFRTWPGSVLQGQLELARLPFGALAQEHSAIVPLRATSLTGWQESAPSALAGDVSSGRVFVIGREPLLDAQIITNGARRLTLYGHAGRRYVIDTTTNFAGADWWATQEVQLAGTREWSGPLDSLAPALFCRVREVSALLLSIREQAGAVLIEWEGDCANCTLEESGALGSNANWVPASLQPMPQGGRWQVTLPHNGANRFYRVVKP